MSTRLVLVVWLGSVWILLWGEVSFANSIVGLIIGAGITAAFPAGRSARLRISPLRLLRFAGWFVVALTRSSFQVAIGVLRPRLDLAEGIVAVPLRSESPLVAAVVADTITLTPGTLTVETGEDPSGATVLYVHCLVVTEPDRVRATGRRIEDLVVGALGGVV